MHGWDHLFPDSIEVHASGKNITTVTPILPTGSSRLHHVPRTAALR
jgi:hypothetical protein